MEGQLKAELGLSVLKSKGAVVSGSISEGRRFETENGDIFVKTNRRLGGKVMFDGELEGLNAIKKTNTVRVPTPIKVLSFESSTGFAMEYIEMKALSQYAEQLGEQLARMHLFNINLQASDSSINKSNDDEQPVYVDKFGFHTTTCCGFHPLVNSWKDDWVEFYAQQRLAHQVNKVIMHYGDREIIEYWSELSVKIPSFFEGIEIKPSLLHGDLWSGNAGETNSEPVIFDAAVFYGHSEFELSIADMFGGFPRSFYNAYHNILPKDANFDKRKDLYKLFHCLNHWNHFGSGYRSSSISIMKRLLKN